MYFYFFRVFHREFLWPTGVNFNNIAWISNGYALFNASRSSLYISSSVEACPLWKCCLFTDLLQMFSYVLLSLLRWQWFSFTLTLYHKIHELFYLWCQTNLKLQENCAINAQAANHLKTAVIVTFLARSLALHRTAEPQEALWHYNIIYVAVECYGVPNTV